MKKNRVIPFFRFEPKVISFGFYKDTRNPFLLDFCIVFCFKFMIKRKFSPYAVLQENVINEDEKIKVQETLQEILFFS